MTISQNIHRALGATAAAGVLALASISPAFAHDQLVSANPEDGAKLTEAPQEITMTFSGDITDVDGGNQVRVTDADGHDVTKGNLSVEGKKVTQPISGHGADDDTYTVTWRVVSEDGHPIQGEQTLTVGKGKESSASASPAASEEAEHHHDHDEKVQEATQGLPMGAKIALFAVGAVAIIGGVVVILAKRPKNK